MTKDMSREHPIIQEFVAALMHQRALSRETIDDVIPVMLRDVGVADDDALLALRQILSAQTMTIEASGEVIAGLLTMFTLGMRLVKKGLI